jgi:hexulose-6-phosphate isomerase
MTKNGSLKESAINNRIGFMQGRLSPIRNDRIQSFPWGVWQKEFESASQIAIGKMEWTIDSENFLSNPLITSFGRQEIITLKSLSNMDIPSVTCDFFMENPPWKSNPEQVLIGIETILLGMVEIDSKILVIPLVDNSSLGSSVKPSQVKDFFKPTINLLSKNNIKIAFETDLAPDALSEFIEEFDDMNFGINYDIGNSASLGFDPTEEFAAIGNRVINVHVKDRTLGGMTVPLGRGNADFPRVFRCLNDSGYVGNLIMQTARAGDSNHVEVLEVYRNQVVRWMEESK